MFGIHLKRGSEKIVAVADIGSGSAALALVAVPKTGPVRLLTVKRSILSLEERSPQAIASAIGAHLLEAGQQVLSDYHKNGSPLPESVYAVIRAPWTRSKTIRAHADFPQATRITGAMIRTLAQQALRGESDSSGGIIEAGVIRVEVGGYPTSEPEGKPGSELAVTALVSVCEAALCESVTRALQQLFGARSITMRSGVHAILSVMRNTPEAPEDFLVVDMASEGTNFTVVRDSVTTEHGETTEGRNAILKRISPDGMPEGALALLRLVARESCHDSACEELNLAVAKAEPELVRVFGEVIAKLVSRERLPNHLILATHEDLVPWLTKLFSRIDFAQFTTTTQPFIVFPLRPADFGRWVSPESAAQADTGILIAAALVNIEHDRG